MKRSRFRLNKKIKPIFYYLVQDRDFKRLIAKQDLGYYFVSNSEKATVFFTENEALEFIGSVKPPSKSNFLEVIKKQY